MIREVLKSVVFIVVVAGLILAAPGYGHKPKAGKEITIVGQVVDTACYLGHDSKGKDHIACATECAKAGIPLAILDAKSQQLYLPLASDHHKAANSQLMPYVEKQVRIDGVLVEKNGVKAIVIQKIEAAD